MFRMAEAMHFKFSLQPDTEEYYHMHNRLPWKGVCSGHMTSKFWEIIDNILEMVQGKNIVTMED